MKLLGVDYGKKKIGLAISEGLTASPYKTLEVTSLEDSLNKILSVISKEGIAKIVIGKPESGESLNMIKNFLKGFRERSSVEIVEIDENLTSINAREKMILYNTSKKSRKKDDAMAASLILEEYLESL